MTDIKEAVEEMLQKKGMTKELLKETIEQTLKSAYKSKFKTDENAVINFSDDLYSFELLSRRTVVEDEDYPPHNILLISLSEAREYNDEAEPGDEILIPLDPHTFNRSSVQTGKQKTTGMMREKEKEDVLLEFRSKVGEIINGYVQVIQKNGDMMIDLGTTSGILPRKNQSPKELYMKGSKIRCYVESAKEDEKNDKNVRVLLSRTHENFMKKLFFLNVPELGAREPSLEIVKIVREPGYRTKVAVRPIKADVDAVGTCIGLKGARIQAIMREISDEHIDVIKWDEDPRQFIANALAPAKVDKIYVLDPDKKIAVAIVDDTNLPAAIGKQGLNVRLVNRMCDWVVDVKVQEDFEKMEEYEKLRLAADAAFNLEDEDETENEEDFVYDEEAGDEGADDQQIEESDGIPLSELPFGEEILKKLEANDILTVQDFLEYSDEELKTGKNLSDDEIKTINNIIRENIDIVEEEDDEANVQQSFVCPNCGYPVEVGVTECPNCHVGLSFKVEGEQEK